MCYYIHISGGQAENMSAERTTILLQLSPELKDAIQLAATKKNVSAASFIRSLVATYVGYDLTADKPAPKKKGETTASLARILILDHQRQQRQADAAALQSWLDRRAAGQLKVQQKG